MTLRAQFPNDIGSESDDDRLSRDALIAGREFTRYRPYASSPKIHIGNCAYDRNRTPASPYRKTLQFCRKAFLTPRFDHDNPLPKFLRCFDLRQNPTSMLYVHTGDH
jgi:hypothetical protein